MAYNFKKLSEVDEISALGESDKILVQHDGEVKQIGADKVGGSGDGGFLTIDAVSATVDSACMAIVSDSDYLLIKENFGRKNIIIVAIINDYNCSTLITSKYTKSANAIVFGGEITGGLPLIVGTQAAIDEAMG